MLESTGISISGVFGDSWDRNDPLALSYNNQTQIAWFAYEHIALKLKDYLEK